MTLTEPLIRPNTRERPFRRPDASGWLDRNGLRVIVVGCIAFWTVVAALVYAAF